MLVLLMLACGEVEKIPQVEEDVLQDFDGDGYLDGEDCDDNNSAVHFNAIEICDGMDNNCDGDIDEGVLTTFFVDGDGDGFGNPNISIEECEGRSGFVGNASDCDDNNENSFPGATEICDELDNDCNNEIDDGIGQTFYIDSDNDGFGSEPIETCQIREGISSIDGDCDDSNPNISPIEI
jgi:large repetitive protein